ncbi:MAG: C4-dicarboxylate ABC transporter, partial [Gammaproteobacteria bacterium]|nr:C4-dicarboxylate ABC transporter [Gammaproteobacteria bacterium]
GNARAGELNAGARQNILDSDRSEIVELDQAELDAWRRAMAPVWETFRDEIGAELIDAAAAFSAGS